MDVGEPCATGFLEGVGDVVAVLDGFSVEEAEGGAFEGLGECSGEGGQGRLGREHDGREEDGVAFFGVPLVSIPLRVTPPSVNYFH